MDNQPTPVAPPPPEPATEATPNMGAAEVQLNNPYDTPVPQVKYSFWKDPTVLKVFGIGIGAVILAIVSMIFVSTQSNRSAEIVETLSLRLTNLTSIRAEYGTPNMLNNSDLRKISTNLGSSLSTASRDIGPFLPEFNLNAKNPTASIKTREDGIATSIREALEEAQMNGRLDREFAIAFSDLLLDTLDLLAELDNRNATTALHEYITLAKTSLQSIKIELDAFIKIH